MPGKAGAELVVPVVLSPRTLLTQLQVAATVAYALWVLLERFDAAPWSRALLPPPGRGSAWATAATSAVGRELGSWLPSSALGPTGWLAAALSPLAAVGAVVGRALQAWEAVNGTWLGRAARVAVGALLVFGGLQLRETVLAQMRAADMGPKHGTKVTRLLTEGAFAYARHPIYVAAGLASFGLAIALNSVFHFWAWLVYYIYLRAYVIPKEERSLKGWFGGAYVAYSYKVSRWGVPVPFL